MATPGKCLNGCGLPIHPPSNFFCVNCWEVARLAVEQLVTRVKELKEAETLEEQHGARPEDYNKEGF